MRHGLHQAGLKYFRAIESFGQTTHGSAGHAGGAQLFDPMVARLLDEDGFEEGHEDVAMFDPVSHGSESRIFCEVGAVEGFYHKVFV